jgi:hypothetical protein
LYFCLAAEARKYVDEADDPLSSSPSKGLVLKQGAVRLGSEEVFLEVLRVFLVSNSSSESKGFGREGAGHSGSTLVCLEIFKGDFFEPNIM